MEIAHTVLDLQSVLTKYQSDNTFVGFVPTMGALHAGHLSLINKSQEQNEITVVSIFVNPTQFNNISDLENYPRTINEDCKLLSEAGVDIVFIPSVGEIYPEPDTRVFYFGQLEKVMEGMHRPGHFNGVAQVVSKLFDIVKPKRAYFGEKDFQQLAIIRELVEKHNIPVEIIAVPIMREKSGLAMSSRNKRLSDSEKILAANIYKVLQESKSFYQIKSIPETISYVIETLNKIQPLEVEYFEIVDGKSLQSIDRWSESDYIVGCIAVYCGEIRLIDNLFYTD